MKYTPYKDDRILFTIRKCEHCRQYSFIESLNQKLKINKRIQVVNCSNYYDYGIIDDPIIRKYKKYLKGGFPILFFDGFVYDGAELKFVLEAFLKALVNDDFEIEEENKYLFNKECRFVPKKLFGGRLICE